MESHSGFPHPSFSHTQILIVIKRESIRCQQITLRRLRSWALHLCRSGQTDFHFCTVLSVLNQSEMSSCYEWRVSCICWLCFSRAYNSFQRNPSWICISKWEFNLISYWKLSCYPFIGEINFFHSDSFLRVLNISVLLLFFLTLLLLPSCLLCGFTSRDMAISEVLPGYCIWLLPKCPEKPCWQKKDRNRYLVGTNIWTVVS